MSISHTAAGALPVADSGARSLIMRSAWIIGGLVVAAVCYYVVGIEQGAISLIAGSDVHELMHDGRHLLGFPCH